MARLRLLWVLAVLGCNGDEESVEPAPAVRWGSVEVLDLELSLPEFFRDGEDSGGGVVFRGPEDEGFRTVVILDRRPWRRGAEHWRRHYVDKFDDPRQTLVEVLERGTARVAGVTASCLVYAESGAGHDVITIDWYFWRAGYGYVLRCTSTARTFAFRYRPLFDEVARRLRART